ncbi:tRNA1Val (adenine37-N6)-methyltransferase [Mycoplasmopsis mustelae]|uniref:tRNA1Val (Adenine37-N6)-methyltransferase n=1 Tax=Mycoplasmopsis mustelae TaxID=171289 RepID=A0A4R7UCJ1_9BACT|nr:tRNA1(Val) (adenine(37)-N6)-methyltransferase [Mycoplasmopsis mustelae]TDV24162.1 tRNA1Val (adenine37-N6)-methyltransferase [Mycoplasmopsis mustelae]
MKDLKNKLHPANPNWVKNSLGFDSNLWIYQDKSMFNYSVDTILLGNFISLNKKTKRALEIGTNNAALAIFIAKRSENLSIDAIEIQSKAIELAQINIGINNLNKQINLIHSDFKDYWKNMILKPHQKYQVIFCNPPFYKNDASKIKKNINVAKLIATHEINLNLEDLVLGCSKIIEQKGFLSLVLPIERTVDIFETLRKYKFEPKRIQMVFTRQNSKPKFILIESRYQAGWGSHFLPNLYLHDANDKLNHTYLPEIKKLYKPLKV